MAMGADLHRQESAFCCVRRGRLSQVVGTSARLLMLIGVLIGAPLLQRHAGPTASADEHDVLELLRAQPAHRSLQEVRAAYLELEQRREDAIRVLFNRMQYVSGSMRYPLELVQPVLEQRIARVRESWDSGPACKLAMSTQLASVLARASAKRAVVEDREEAALLGDTIAWITLHVSVGRADVRSYFSDASEYAWLEYSQRVRAVNREIGSEVIEPWIRSLVDDINDYRAMIGRAADVEPLRAESFDRDSVASVLDRARIVETCPLLALRLSPELCNAAAKHAQDAETRGYKGLTWPPDPATGQGRVDLDHWAAAHGYSMGGVEALRFKFSAGMPSTLQTLRRSRLDLVILGAYLDVGLGRFGDSWVLYLGGLYWDP